MDRTIASRRLFLAARPVDPAIAALTELTSLASEDGVGVRLSPRESWHVTLRFLGDADPDAVLDAVAPTMPPPPLLVVLGPRVTLLGTAVVVPAHGLDELAAAISRATAGLGEAEQDRPFLGHLTIGRVRRPDDGCVLVGERIATQFELAGVELLASESTGDGSRYETVQRWPATPR